MNLMVAELTGILAGAKNGGPGRWAVPALCLLLSLLTGACNTTKYLAADQELLTAQRVELRDPKNVDNRTDLTYQLSTLTRQQPNGNFFGIWPREYFYLANNKPKDTTSIDRFLRGTIGQQPAIYSDSLSRRSAAAMQDLMRYRGYFDARAYHEADRGSKRRKVNVIYHVEAGRRYLIDSVAYTSADPALDSLLQVAKRESQLRTGEPLDLTKFEQEKARVGELLRNNGFAFFSGAYIDQLEVDTTRRKGYADIFFNILPPQREAVYEQYRVGDVTVYTSYDPARLGQDSFLRDTTLNGVRFLTTRRDFRIRPDILRSNIYLESDALSSRSALERTNLALNELGIYRFVRINPQVDSLQPNTINYFIQLSPGNKMSLGADFDVNYTNRNGTAGAGNLVGLSVEPSFQNRNVFGGAELLTASVRAGVEINPRPSDNNPFFNTIDLAADLSLNLPRFKDFGLYRLLNKLPAPYPGKLIGDGTLAQLRDRANTRFSLGYEYLLIRQLFAYTIFNAALGYDFRKNNTTSYRINHLTIDILDPTIEPQFEAVLEENQRLRRSFGSQYFFSILFRNLEYNRAGRPDRRGRSVAFTSNFEVAGLEILLADEVIGAISGEDSNLRPGSQTTFAKYARLQSSIRYKKAYTPQTSLATRFALEVGHAFGTGDDMISNELPYVKQFFVGGANSMRAWAPRGLGPGGYVDPLSLNTNNNLFLFQAGDLRLEFNAEYRFPLFSFFRGALFVDAGNIWLLERDEDRPGAQFRFSEEQLPTILAQPFWRQIAVDAGFGLRVDLSYFIFRLDFAVPVRYNYPDGGLDDELVRENRRYPESDYWQSPLGLRFRDIRPQLGLGYPF